MARVVSRHGAGLLLEQQALFLVDLLAHLLAKGLLRLECGHCEPFGLGIGVRNEYVAPDPSILDAACDSRLVMTCLAHRLAVDIHAASGDLVALNVHQEWPPFARHSEHGFLSGARAYD